MDLARSVAPRAPPPLSIPLPKFVGPPHPHSSNTLQNYRLAMQTCRNIQGFLLVSAWGGLHALSPQGHTGCLSCTKTHSYNGPSPRRSAATRCVDFVRFVAVLCECATQNRRFFVFRTMTEFAELAKEPIHGFFSIVMACFTASL